MALYAIGDLHLSLGANKPMDIFGGVWEGYVEKLKSGFSIVGPGDTTVLMGDLSWGHDLEAAEPDFAWISEIPGKKYLLKGNHDYWWPTAAKFEKFCAAHGFQNLELLHNNCKLYGETALCGSRGWFFEEDRAGTHDDKIYNRELRRLEVSLQAAGEREKICFLHYPPRYRGYRCPEILDLLSRYHVKRCLYAHLHGGSHRLAIEGEADGVNFSLVSADSINFQPKRVL